MLRETTSREPPSPWVRPTTLAFAPTSLDALAHIPWVVERRHS